VIEWNIHQSSQGDAGMWDSHIRFFRQPVLCPICELNYSPLGLAEVFCSCTKSNHTLNTSHVALGTNLELSTCPAGSSSSDCFAAFLALHLTPQSSAYLEVCLCATSICVELTISKGTWVWLADHDLDGQGNTTLTLYSGRGILSQSAGPVWMIGTGTSIHELSRHSPDACCFQKLVRTNHASWHSHSNDNPSS
jgi:glucan 1,3-beta-glucosidase